VESVNLISAFVLGLMGAGHCFAMCGGIISTLSVSTGAAQSTKNWSAIIIYQLGRISSYTLFGAIAGWFGYQFNTISPLPILKVVSGILMIAMALYLSNLWQGIQHLERIGKLIWNKISPFSKKLLPVKNIRQAFLLGTLWGWLPCGLVYTSLGYALSLGNSLSSAGFMLFFGIGTLPATLLAGATSLTMKSFLTNVIVRYTSVLLFLLIGIYTLYTVFENPGNHFHH